jgi:hypothetical protein
LATPTITLPEFDTAFAAPTFAAKPPLEIGSAAPRLIQRTAPGP